MKKDKDKDRQQAQQQQQQQQQNIINIISTCQTRAQHTDYQTHRNEHIQDRTQG